MGTAAPAKSKLNLGELNKLYREGEAADRDVFAEMRSNLLLVAGEHWNKTPTDKYRSHIRESRDLSDVQKIRLTKNHTHRVHRRYTQAIRRYAGGIAISPHKEDQVQDQKSAELNQSVWTDYKQQEKWTERVRKFVDDFVDIGEVAAKLFWDPTKGEFVGYAHAQRDANEDDGEWNDESGFVYDQDGQPVADETYPVFKGGVECERLYGFNLWRDVAAKDMRDSRLIGIRKMVPVAKLKAVYKNDAEKLKFLERDQNEEYIVFDASRNGYERSAGMTLVKECYWKPCEDYPEGYFAIWTSAGILEEGPLPFGIFPIKWKGFDEHASTPRGRSIIKQARPFQAEINRASSACAMAQITLGDDKILYQAGSKLSPGALLPGVRGISFNGKQPQILPGRDGGQFLAYIEAQIAEMDRVLELEELDVEINGQLDPHALLFRSAKEREKFSIYSEKFEEFHIEVVETILRLCKEYYDDDRLVPAIGTKEYVNITEFRSTVPQAYRIHVEAVDETLETKLGAQISIQHVLQYVGNQLGKDDIGKLIEQMPYGNMKEGLSDLTLDYRICQNDFLALERGQFSPAQPEDTHTYMIKKISARMREPDFQFLSPQIQQLFKIRKQQHEQFQAQEQQKLIDAKNEYIPSDGPMIACDMYVPNEEDPSKAPRRARIPQNSLDWLIQRLEAQGQNLQKLEQMNQANLIEIAGYTHQGQPQLLPPGAGPQGGPQMPNRMGGGPSPGRPPMPQMTGGQARLPMGA